MKLSYEGLDHFILLIRGNRFIGQLNYISLVSLILIMLSMHLPAIAHDNLREAFRIYGDKNGMISPEKLREILGESGDVLNSEELDVMMDEIDSDGSGTVDFGEFMEIMTGD